MSSSETPTTPKCRQRIPRVFLVLCIFSRQITSSFPLTMSRSSPLKERFWRSTPLSSRFHATDGPAFHGSNPHLRATSAASSMEADEDNQNYNWNKQNLAIGAPALVGMLVDPLLSLMDTAYVGRVGSIELAALGACTSIFHLAFNAFRSTTSATTALVATCLENDEESAKEVTSISLNFGFWIGVAVSAILLLGGQAALTSMGVAKGSELFPAASDYLYTRAWAAPVVLLIVVAEGAFRGYGNTVVPLVASLVAASINLVLDPILMFRPVHWGVKGAAAATALSQVGAAAVYATKLIRKRMLPSRQSKTLTATTKAEKNKRMSGVIRTIVEANVAMLMKQGSLLLGWAYATARATRLGSAQVAAHQVALSVWLLFALVLDATAVSAQVLMSRAYAAVDKPRVNSLTRYMLTFAIGQGLLSMLIVDGIDAFVPSLFTPDAVIQGHLHNLMRPLAFQQLLVSLTLVLESLAVGANQFRMLAVGTAISTVVAVWQLSRQTCVTGIWTYGITSLFAGRLLTSIFACWRGRSIVSRKYDQLQGRNEETQ